MVRHECPSTHDCCQYVSDVDRQWTFFSYQGTYSFDIYKKKLLERACFSLKLMTVLPLCLILLKN
jgi:hypothetical protein